MTEAITEDDGSKKLLIDLLAVFLLYQAIDAGAGALTAIVEAGMGFPPGSPTYQTAHFQNSVGSVVWMAVLCAGSALAWRYAKPSPKIWMLPFLLAMGWWWLDLAICDEPIDAVHLEFARRMFLACSVVTVLGTVRLMLGEGRQQTKTLKRLFFGDGYEPSVMPKETLLRAASLSDTSREILLRPMAESAESTPEQLLHASQTDDL